MANSWSFPNLFLQQLTVPSALVVCLLSSFAGVALYRCFLSPLARSKIPGSRLAALTSWYECYYDVVQQAQYAFKIKEMHAEYGPIIRIGPNDVSISDPDFTDTVYAPGPGHKRDKDHAKNKALGVDSSVGGSITHNLHRRRREALNPFFSSRLIHRGLESELKALSEQMESVFAKAKDTKTVVNLSDLYYAFANDIVHKYCFGNSPNLLSDLDLAHIRRTNVAAVLGSVKVMLHFGWIRDLMELLPLSVRWGMMPPGVRDMMTFRAEIRQQIDRLLAATGPASKNGAAPSIFTHLRDNGSLPESEKTAQRLEDEAVLMTMAGSYSPMLSLATAHYYLVSRPDIMRKLRAELVENKISVRSTAQQLEQLPYLSGIIHEAHRLTFGLTGRNPRVCPDETLVYTDTTSTTTPKTYPIPPGTSISVSTLLIHTNESLFPDPWKFDPSRWMLTASSTEDEKEAVRKRQKALLAFNRGPRACIGAHLANAEMAVAVAAMARWDMELFETSEKEDVRFSHDYHVMCPGLGSKGVRVQALRRH
ncbi:Trichodiene oxygenase [Rhypophila decipiens]